MFRQLFILTSTVFILAFTAYWGKCYMGWNLVDSFSLGDYLPVQFMYNKNAHVIAARAPGVLFEEDFEGVFALRHWLPVWSREPGAVAVGLDTPGESGTLCLRVESGSDKDWSLSYHKMVKAQPGDTFCYRGYMRLEGDGPIKGALSLVLYDAEQKVLDYGYAREKMDAATDWIQFVREFIVPEGAAYFRLHMTGKGVGRVWFDDVALEKQGQRNGDTILN